MNLDFKYVTILFVVSWRSEFVKTIRSVGSRGNEPLESVPPIVTRTEWDGLDGELPEEEEFSLDDLMNDDVEVSKDEL